MHKNGFYPLLDVLRNAENIDTNLALYFVQESPYTASSLCGLFDLDEEEIADDGTELGFPVEHNLTQRWQVGLSVQDTKSIILVASRQRPILTDDELIQSFNFYVEKDGYLSFDA